MDASGDNGAVTADLIKGALAGGMATWVMGEATTWMYEHEKDAVREREDAAREGQTAYVAAAGKVASLSGVELSDDQQKKAGTVIHWTLGIAAGAAYGMARRRFSGSAALKALSFGGGFFLLMDEVINPAFGLTPGPTAFQWQTHARGLAGHLVFGLVSEGVLQGLDQAVPNGRFSREAARSWTG